MLSLLGDVRREGCDSIAASFRAWNQEACNGLHGDISDFGELASTAGEARFEDLEPPVGNTKCGSLSVGVSY
jgi:hypothetical protein